MGSGSPNYGLWNAFGFRSSSAESEDIEVVILETASIIRSLVGTGDESAASDTERGAQAWCGESWIELHS